MYPDSLGLFYGTFTQYLGFRPHSDEWKFMALGALYPDQSNNRFDQIVRDLIYVEELEIRIKSDFFGFDQPDVNGKKWYKIKLVELLKIEPLASWNDKKERSELYYELAAAVQHRFETIVFELIENAVKKTDINNITLTGGCAMNSLCNGKLKKRFPSLNIYIPPYPDDSGIVIGAAIVGTNSIKLKTSISEYTYTGGSHRKEEIKDILDSFGLKYKERNSQWYEVAKNIADGKIIGLFQGKSEFGQRALGNRSILADPRSSTTKDKLNRAIKFREGFRPFAPSVIDEDAIKIFENYEATYFMERVLMVKDEWKEKVPAIVHNDGTARLQTVSLEVNEQFYRLISEFKQITGVPMVVNTSFNLNGEPNVETPQDAIRTFFTCGLDMLVLEDYIIEK